MTDTPDTDRDRQFTDTPDTDRDRQFLTELAAEHWQRQGQTVH